MIVLKVFLGLLLVLFLLGLLRVGGRAEYSAQGFLVKIKAGPLWFQVFPGKERADKEEKPKKPKKKKKKETDQEPEEPKKGGTLELIWDLLPLVKEAAGGLLQRIRIDRLDLDYTAGGKDAAKTATSFGYSSAAIGAILPVLESCFEVKERRIRTAVDFAASEPSIYLNLIFTARLGQLVCFGLRMGWKFLKIYRRHKGQTTTKKEAN